MESCNNPKNNHESMSNNNDESMVNQDFQQLLIKHESLANKYEALLEKIKEKKNMDDEYADLVEDFKESGEQKMCKKSEVVNDDKDKIDPNDSNESLLKEIEDLRIKNKESKEKEAEAVRKHAALDKKHTKLVTKMRDRIECPVCLDVPESGPVFTCTNGHLVCSKCKKDLCPTCRVRMGEGKSLLAVAVLENIDHKCRNQGCEQFLPLSELGDHKITCEHRLVTCPSTLCNMRISFSGVIDHLMNKCHYSYCKIDQKIKDLTSEKGYSSQKLNIVNVEAYEVDTFLCNGKYFFLNITSGYGGRGNWTFHVEMLGSEEECAKFKVDLFLHKHSDRNADDQHTYRFLGDPVQMEEDKEVKKQMGLIVSNRVMELKLSKNEVIEGGEDSVFWTSISVMNK